MLGSGDSLPVLMHVTYLAHLLAVRSLASQQAEGLARETMRLYQYTLTCTGLAPNYLLRARLRPNRYCACAERVAFGDSTSKEKLARAGLIFLWTYFRLTGIFQDLAILNSTSPKKISPRRRPTFT